ncbi:hypothetical protein BYT27DRAFT_7261206 [Phlegmacium glaucopus]|nr:hypothetical protein BYT27DRAFT_7261206 [Phlegmacium glaucopus]
MQFAEAALKFYYIPEQIGDLRNEELLYASKDNVLIETLPSGMLGLPITAEPVYDILTESGQSIRILHPSVLILTKLKRWSCNYDSTRPKTVLKNKSDQKDISYLLNWLADKEMTVAFEDYKGKTKDDLLVYVRNYRDKFRDDVELIEVLKSVMKPDDWKAL